MLIDTIEPNRRMGSIDKIIFYLCILDIFFLPYIRILSSSISMIVLPLWFLLNLNRIRINKELQLFLILLFFVIISLFSSIINYPSYIVTNISYIVIFLYGFLYYFFFKFYLSNSNVLLQQILILYITFVFVLAVLYYINPNTYFQVRSLWTMGGNIIEVGDSLLIHRFTGTFSDPNNGATVFVAIATFLLFNTNLNVLQSIYVIVTSICIVFVTMSSTGFILLGITLFLTLLKTLKRCNKNIKIKISTILIIIFILPIFVYFLVWFINTEVAQLALYRFSENSTESRSKIWLELLKSNSIFKHVLFGFGGTIDVNGMPYRPHNGHLHLIYNYGMIVYVIFMYIFFRFRKNKRLETYYFLIPFFLGFTINVGVYEPRFINLLSLLVAVYASDKNNNKFNLLDRYN